jgi:hypothetical protein
MTLVGHPGLQGNARMAVFLTIFGYVLAGGLILLAAFLAQTPWRAHGGRFIAEYMILAATVATFGLIILALARYFGRLGG